MKVCSLQICLLLRIYYLSSPLEAEALFLPEKMECRLTKLLPTLAYSSHLDKKFFMITFCPWFLDYAMRKDFQFTNALTDVAKRTWARYPVVPGVRALLFK